jgi:hypothetical protein
LGFTTIKVPLVGGKTARLAGVTIHDAASFVSSANALVAAEQRGAKTKKRLAIDAIEVEIVRMIFRLAYEGKGSNGPLGVKALACHLNEHDHRTRRGARWGIAPCIASWRAGLTWANTVSTERPGRQEKQNRSQNRLPFPLSPFWTG